MNLIASILLERHLNIELNDELFFEFYMTERMSKAKRDNWYIIIYKQDLTNAECYI